MMMTTLMKMKHLLLLVAVKREEVTTVIPTRMKTLVTTLMPVRRSTVMKVLTAMKVLARTGPTSRLRLLRTTATEKMMVTIEEEREVVVVAVAEIGRETGIINLPRRANTELRRSTRASTVIVIETEARTGRGREAVPLTRVQRRNLDTTNNFEDEEYKSQQTDFLIITAYFIFSYYQWCISSNLIVKMLSV